jgi:hypothetical protein
MSVDHTGRVYGRLIVKEPVGVAPTGHRLWRCTCICGREIVRSSARLRPNVLNQSCGCYTREATSLRSRKHGLCSTKTYKVWTQMHRRCRQQKPGYVGVTVCTEWADFLTFLEDMGACPEGMTLDRLDGAKGYEPQNCRWATPTQQANNRRSNHRLFHAGESRTISEWSRVLGLNKNTILSRLRRGCSEEDALTF